MKIVLWVFGCLVVLVGAGMLLMNAGMGSVKAIEIGAVDLSGLADGVYHGGFKRGRWACKVEVTVKDHRIVKVVTLDDRWNVWQKLTEDLSARILREQSLKVDAVSGATVSSKALLKAIENALRSEPSQ